MADFEMANLVSTSNAKTQRPSVCNAAEKLLVHAAVAAKFIPQIARKLTDAGVELRGDAETCRIALEFERPQNKTGVKNTCACAWRSASYRMWTKPSNTSIDIQPNTPRLIVTAGQTNADKFLRKG